MLDNMSSDKRQKLASMLKIDDPKKLDQKLVRVDGYKLLRTTRDFLQKLMVTTRTWISLPSPKNLDPKTQRNVFVKIAGLPESILRAETEVVQVLRPPAHFVSLKLEVSHTCHSHIIGKDGASVKKIQEETRCNIHFPDCNLRINHEKSNVVIVSGETGDVEKARRKIRQTSPWVVTFKLPGSNQLTPQNSEQFLRVQRDYAVEVHVRIFSKFPSTLVIVSGLMTQANNIKMATKRLLFEMFGNKASEVQLQTTMEVSPQHHATVLARLDDIMWNTGTTIIAFRDGGNPNIVLAKKNNVTIVGSVDAVYAARQQLLDCLPMTLVFHVDREVSVQSVAQALGVSIQAKQRMDNFMVSITAPESQAGLIYEAKRQLLGGDARPGALHQPGCYSLWSGFDFVKIVIPTKKRNPDGLDMTAILKSVGLEKYLGVFGDLEVEAFARLTEQDLQKLRIDDWEVRRKFMLLVVQLRNVMERRRAKLETTNPYLTPMDYWGNEKRYDSETTLSSDVSPD